MTEGEAQGFDSHMKIKAAYRTALIYKGIKIYRERNVWRSLLGY